MHYNTTTWHTHAQSYIWLYIETYLHYVCAPTYGHTQAFNSGELIVSKYVAESITMIAGRFVVIDSTTYLLTISSPDIKKVAMSLYDIKLLTDWLEGSPYI